MGCGSSRAVPVVEEGALQLVSPDATQGGGGGAGAGTPGGGGGLTQPGVGGADAASAPATRESAAPAHKASPARGAGDARGGETVVAAALKSQKQRGEVILGEGMAQVQLTKNYVKRHVDKPAEIRTLLLQAVRGNVLFGALGDGEVQDLVDAMEPRRVAAGTVVISQGDPGDNFYVVESGSFEIIVGGRKVADWGEGTKNKSFGELALLYNSPRAATVRAVTDAHLWAIDRLTFRSVVAQASFAQHEKLKAALRRGILESLSDAQLDRIADAATVVRYARGDQIIRKGEEGEVFFIIESGSVICKNMSGDQSNNVLHEGDYFGERALLKREPRAADVYAESDVSLIALHREDFENLLGELREVLEHNQGMRLLLCMPVLAALSDADRASLFASLRIATYEDGQAVMPEGTVPTHFFIVKDGAVAVVRRRAPTMVAAAADGAATSSLLARPGSGAADARVRPESAAGAAAQSPSRGGAASASPRGVVSDTVQLLLPGHFFPRSELVSQTPLPVSYVATHRGAAAGGGSGGSGSGGAGAGGPVQLFVTDRSTYLRILAPLVGPHQHRSAAGAHLSPSPDVAAATTAARAASAASRSAAAPGAKPPRQPVDAASVPRGSAGDRGGSPGAGAGGAGAARPSPAAPRDAAAPAATSSFGLGPGPGSDGSVNSSTAAVAGGGGGRYAAAAQARSTRKRLGIPFKELEQRATLGTGTFGRVRLVHHRRTGRVYALKMLQKSQVVALKQQGNIMSERELLWRCDHPFVIKLYDTYRDRDRLYMLLELVQGGELFARLQNAPVPGRITAGETRFYGACVLDAFDYLHAMKIVYRDLKPENLLIDAEGYLKLVDFGFAKVVNDKTYTLCGTPEYLAPELVIGRGHDKGVDYWALGILLYEQVAGYSPFADHEHHDQMAICKSILRGEFEFPAWVKDKELRDIINRLLQKDVARRLGCLRGGAGDVKAHRFFRPIDFDQLYRKALPAPWKPKLAGTLDTSNFEAYEENDVVEPYTGDADWDKDF